MEYTLDYEFKYPSNISRSCMVYVNGLLCGVDEYKFLGSKLRMQWKWSIGKGDEISLVDIIEGRFVRHLHIVKDIG